MRETDIGGVLVRCVYADRIARDHTNRNARENRVKQAWSVFALVLLFSLNLSGCELIGDIFKAGVWVGVILVVLVIAGYRLDRYQEQGLLGRR